MWRSAISCKYNRMKLFTCVYLWNCDQIKLRSIPSTPRSFLMPPPSQWPPQVTPLQDMYSFNVTCGFCSIRPVPNNTLVMLFFDNHGNVNILPNLLFLILLRVISTQHLEFSKYWYPSHHFPLFTRILIKFSCDLHFCNQDLFDSTQA